LPISVIKTRNLLPALLSLHGLAYPGSN